MKRKVYRVPWLGVIAWYALVLIIGTFLLKVFRHLPDAPPLLTWIFGAMFIVTVIAPLSVVGGMVSVETEGLRQSLPFSSWHLQWGAVDGWSHIEIFIGSPDGGGSWRPYVFVRRQTDGQIFYPHQWIVWGKRVKELADRLREHCGEPTSDPEPVIHRHFKHARWRIV